MDRSIYTMMNAATSASERHSINANNLANISTAGFRSQIAMLQSVEIKGPTLPTRALSTNIATKNSDLPGAINYSGRDLDVAIINDGWLSVKLKNEIEGYTKNGHITIDEEGKLRIKNYILIGSDGNAIEVPPGSKLTISSDGIISALGAGDPSKSIAPIGKLKLVKAKINEFHINNDGVFTTFKNKKLIEDISVKLIPKSFEESNVQSVDAMIKIINDSRNFEIHMKVINDINENSRLSNQLLSFNQI